MSTVCRELAKTYPAASVKPQVFALNKMDQMP